MLTSLSHSRRFFSVDKTRGSILKIRGSIFEIRGPLFLARLLRNYVSVLVDFISVLVKSGESINIVSYCHNNSGILRGRSWE
jgi:hypothetical protein